MTPEIIRILFEYNAWANRRILDACVLLPDHQFTRDMGSSFRSVRDTLAHIMGGEWIWLERWQGRMPTTLPKAADYPDLSSIRRRWSELDKELQKFVAGLTEQDLARVQEIRTTEGKLFQHPLWQMLQHLANHSTYHRGQVTTLLRQLDIPAVATDLIAFYRQRNA